MLLPFAIYRRGLNATIPPVIARFPTHHSPIFYPNGVLPGQLHISILLA